MKGYPEQLQLLLKQQASVFHPDIRMVCKEMFLHYMYCTCTLSSRERTWHGM